MGATQRGLSNYRGKPDRLLETNPNRPLSYLSSTHDVGDLRGTLQSTMKEVDLLKIKRLKETCPFLEKLLRWFSVPARLPLQLCSHLTF